MMHITGYDRSQTLLLPDAVDDYVGPDNSGYRAVCLSFATSAREPPGGAGVTSSQFRLPAT